MEKQLFCSWRRQQEDGQEGQEGWRQEEEETLLVLLMAFQAVLWIMKVALAISGSPSSSESPSDVSEAVEITSEAKQKILGVGIRDMKMGPNVMTLGDVTPRQLSYGMAGMLRWVLPSDLLELGGELESRQHLMLMT